MKRNILIVVGISMLVLTAGCSGILGPDETTPTTGTDAPTTESDTTVDEYPSGLSENGVTNVEAAIGSHKAAIISESSWVVNYNTEFTAQNQTQSISETRTVNHEESVELQEVNSQYGEQVTYKVASEGWRQQTAQNSTQYAYAATGYDSTEATHSPMLTSFLGNVNYEQSQSVERDGTTYITYEATGLPADSELAGPANSSSEVENLSSSFTVTESGSITEFDFSATVVSEEQSNSDVNISLVFSEIGTTTVNEPAWLGDAKNETSENAPPAPTPEE